jgi:hypothetical protein
MSGDVQTTTSGSPAKADTATRFGLLMATLVAIFGTGGAGTAWLNQRSEISALRTSLATSEAALAGAKADVARLHEDLVAVQSELKDQTVKSVAASQSPCADRQPSVTDSLGVVTGQGHGDFRHANLTIKK